MNPKATQQLPLRDVHLPAEPGFWPPAPGWWLLAALLLLFLVGLAFWWRRKRLRHKKWQQIRQLWMNIQHDYQSHGDKAQLARDLSDLLRRFTRHQLHKPEAAGLSGKSWIAFLNQDLPEPVFDVFSDTLTTGLYQQHTSYQAEALLQAVHQFLRLHCLQPGRRHT